ncbi:MAG: hypothetical protein NTV78_03090 [Caldiserica bacterium]|nr:hypothetical protein [Caldisericota bacterium]
MRHWNFLDIEESYKRGIVTVLTSYISSYAFFPNNYATRGEFTTMVIRALKFEFLEIPNPFSDIDGDYFGFKEVLTAYNLGIV